MRKCVHILLLKVATGCAIAQDTLESNNVFLSYNWPETHVQDMSAAALRYHKVVKENINLHNKVQDLKG